MQAAAPDFSADHLTCIPPPKGKGLYTWSFYIKGMLIGSFVRTGLQAAKYQFQEKTWHRVPSPLAGKKYAPPKAGIEDYIINLSFNQYRILRFLPFVSK